MRPIPPFDSERPWGAYEPGPAVRAMLAVAHRIPGNVRLFYRLVVALRHSTKHNTDSPLDVSVWGLKLRLLPRGNRSESEMLFAPQFWDRAELAWLAGRLRPGAVFVDVGANAGVYSFFVASRFGDGVRIVAVEPDPEMRRRLSFNAATNNLPMDIRGVALSDHKGTATLATKETQRGQNQLQEDGPALQGRVGVTVDVDTLLSVLEASGVSRIDALKIDIEGHEPRVLGHFFAHAPEHLLPRALITERKDETAAAIGALLRERGYTLVNETTLNWLFERRNTGDGSSSSSERRSTA